MILDGDPCIHNHNFMIIPKLFLVLSGGLDYPQTLLVLSGGRPAVLAAVTSLNNKLLIA
jgi:hypothetical protein